VLWQASQDEFELLAPGVARYRVTGGGPLQVERLPGGLEALVNLFGQGLPQAASWVQRGYLALHAAALAFPEGAVVVAGPAAAGKSLLAAALVQRGYPLLADEVTVLDWPGDGPPVVLPGCPDILLWRQGAEKLGYTPQELTPARPDLERVWLSGLPGAREAQPLRRLILLFPHNQPEPRLETLNGQKKVLAILRQSYNRQLAEAPKRRQRLMFNLARLPGTVRVQRLCRPRYGWSVPLLVDLLEADQTG
jgi:hypothetical protein